MKKNSELYNLIYDALRGYSSAQVNLASEASAIRLAGSISSAISKRFHVAKRRDPLQDIEDKDQLDLFENY